MASSKPEFSTPPPAPAPQGAGENSHKGVIAGAQRPQSPLCDILYGGIEAGGTKFVCIAAGGPGDIRAEARFPTTTPAETFARAVAFFRQVEAEHGRLAALGIGAFGPLDPLPGSPTYGYITSTPKPGWANTDFVGAMRAALELPVGFDTDVNAAALGEWRWGAAQGLDTFIYRDGGHGAVGGGAMVNGRLLARPGAPRDGGTCSSRTIGSGTISPACARITATAWRAWRQAPRWASAGASAPKRSRRNTPPGTWKRTTWRWGSAT